MSIEKFTQGEWTHHLDGTIRNSDCTQIIGTYTMSGPFRNGEQKANAYLIAAAPKMYDYLKSISALIDNLGDELNHDFIKKEIDKLLVEARGENDPQI